MDRPAEVNYDDLLIEKALGLPSDIFYGLALPLNLECLFSPINRPYDDRVSSS